MKPIVLIGILIILVGVFMLGSNGFPYKRDRHNVQIGPFSVGEVEKEERIQMPAVIGIIAIVAGVILILARNKKW